MISLGFESTDRKIGMEIDFLEKDNHPCLEIGCGSDQIKINAKEEDSTITIPAEMVVEEPHVCLRIDEYISNPGGDGRFDYYDGEYTVVPKTEKTILAAKEKIMREDVTVEKIPVHEISNDSGTTIVIGGIL